MANRHKKQTRTDVELNGEAVLHPTAALAVFNRGREEGVLPPRPARLHHSAPRLPLAPVQPEAKSKSGTQELFETVDGKALDVRALRQVLYICYALDIATPATVLGTAVSEASKIMGLPEWTPASGGSISVQVAKLIDMLGFSGVAQDAVESMLSGTVEADHATVKRPRLDGH